MWSDSTLNVDQAKLDGVVAPPSALVAPPFFISRAFCTVAERRLLAPSAAAKRCERRGGASGGCRVFIIT